MYRAFHEGLQEPEEALVLGVSTKGQRPHHVIWRANDRVSITRIFVADRAVNRAPLDCGTVDDLIVLHLVQLQNISICNKQRPRDRNTYLDFQRFYALWVESSSCQPEIC